MDVTLPLPRVLPLHFGLVEHAGNAAVRVAARYDAARKRAKRALRESEGRASKKRQREAGPAVEEAPAAPVAPTDAASAVKTANEVELLDRTVYICAIRHRV